MSITDLRQLMIQRLGETADIITDYHLGVLLREGISSEAHLKVARERVFTTNEGGDLSPPVINLLLQHFNPKGFQEEPQFKQARTDPCRSQSKALAALLGERPDAVPVENMPFFLTDMAGRKLPVVPQVFWEFLASDSSFEDLLTPAEGNLVTYFSALLGNEFFPGGAENNTMVISQNFIGNVLHFLKKNSGPGWHVNFEYDRDTSTSNTTSAISLLMNCQPDFHATLDFRLVLVGEDKDLGVGLKAARGDLVKKAVPLNPTHYGPVKYLLAYTACGTTIGFHWMDLDGKVHDMGNEFKFHLENRMHRVRLLLLVVNVYRLFASMKLPDLAGSVPNNVWVSRENGNKTKRVILASGDRGFLKKVKLEGERKARMMLGLSDEDLKAVYDLGDIRNGIVKVVKTIGDTDADSYTICMRLLGPDLEVEPPTSQREFKAVAKGCLVGVRTMHDKDFGHYDIRESNVAWATNADRTTVVLCDLQYAGRLGAKPESGVKMRDWDGNTLEKDGTYSARSDIYQLSLMLERLSRDKPWEADAQPFIAAMHGTDGKDPQMAQKLLDDAYLKGA